MKKPALFIMILLFSLALAAIESAPSNIVGFVRYQCNAGENFIAMPLDAGYTTVNDLTSEFSQITSVKKWNVTTQQWEIATTLEINTPYLISCNNTMTFYSYGDFNSNAAYNLQTTNTTDANLIMIPLNKGELASAAQLATDITNCNTVSEWISNQQAWKTSTFIASEWENDFTVTVGKVYFVNVTSNTIWPYYPNIQRVDGNETMRGENEK